MTSRRGGIAVPSLAAGGLIALSLPPWGWWPLAFAGAGLLIWRLAGRRLRTRVLAGWIAGVGCFGPGLWWARSFNWYGAVVLTVVEALFMAAAAALVPPRRGRLPASIGAFTLLEALRLRWPFGGLPLGGVFLGQAGGPLLGTARLGGPLLMTATVWAAGAALASCAGTFRPGGPEPIAAPGSIGPAREAEGSSGVPGNGVPGNGNPGNGNPGNGVPGNGVPGATRWAALALAVTVVTVALVADHAPDGGRPAGTVAVAAVQGGGRRGVSQDQVDPATVFAAQLAATRSLEHGARGGPGPGLIVWPEDVIALVGVSSLPRIGPSPRSGELATAGALARRLDATLVAGVTVTVSDRAFRNEIVVWAPSGRIVAIYEKVHRVPFGEYVPYRSLIAHLADLSAVPLDAVPGTGTGLVRTPVGPLGILVSFEVFFADRSRASVRAGAEALVVPTNTSSYATDQVPGQEVAADRIQAVESGRDLVQGAPTGYSTLVRANGDVVERSSLGPPHVLRGTISLRVGTTVYIRFGDLPTLVVAGLALLFGLALGRREAAVSRSSRSGCTRKGSPRRRTSRGWSDRPPAPAEDRIRTGAGPPPPVA